MSHFSKINALINDEEALMAAITKMGFNLVSGGECRYYYGTQRADMVVKLPGKYDLALKKENDHYSMQADMWGGQVEKYVGANAGLLMQQYSVEKARIEAFKNALAVTESKEGSDIVLTLTDSETGGQMKIICYVGGEISIKTTGFPGESCLKFQELESALGTRKEFTPTMEMYEDELVQKCAHVSSASL